MKKLKFWGAVVIILTAATMVHLPKTLAAQGSTSDVCTPGSTPNSCLVTITPESNGTITVTPDKLTIKKKSNQTVEWTCTTDCTFEVDFSYPEGSPFNEKTFKASAQNPHAKSGRANKKGPFRYKVSADGHTQDPQIIVH
jgi:hypothetical protein